jgi:hypothetical protein
MFHDKAAQRMRDFKDIPADAIGGVSAPTLVIVGDADVIRPNTPWKRSGFSHTCNLPCSPAPIT